MHPRLLTITAITVLSFVLFLFPAKNHLQGATKNCGEKTKENTFLAIECWNRIIETELQKKGFERAMVLFKEILAEYPVFSINCHRSAHRVGDLAYREFLHTNINPLKDADLPTTTALCGYGFFHAFIAASIQERPEPTFASETCTQLGELVGSRIPTIREECYDPVGNGFLLHHINTIPKKKWGDTKTFLENPLKKCEEASKNNFLATERCLGGVFTVFYEIMMNETYGFFLNKKKPFFFCDTLSKKYHPQCYAKGMLILDKELTEDPLKLIIFVKQNLPEEIHQKAFRAGVASVFQANTQGFSNEKLTTFIDRCTELDDLYFRLCIKGVVRSFSLNGNDKDIRETLAALCNQDTVRRKDTAGICLSETAAQANRYKI